MSKLTTKTEVVTSKILPILDAWNTTREQERQHRISETIEELKERRWFQWDVPAAIVEACYEYRIGMITDEEAEITINAAEEKYLASK